MPALVNVVTRKYGKRLPRLVSLKSLICFTCNVTPNFSTVLHLSARFFSVFLFLFSSTQIAAVTSLLSDACRRFVCAYVCHRVWTAGTERRGNISIKVEGTRTLAVEFCVERFSMSVNLDQIA